MPKSNKSSIASLAIFFLSMSSALGQSHAQRTTVPKGTLSAHVFAITRAGDVKPAVMAAVYVLYINGIGPKASSEYETGTAGSTYIQQSTKAMKELAERISGSEAQDCIAQLQMFDGVVAKVLEWSEQNKKTAQVVFTHTDEDGRFTLTLRPGQYTILVRGQAGYNQAYWDTNPLNDVTIKANDHVEAKLSSPTRSCIINRR